ncbi:MAG: fibronectin type III domain-containing protein, partial [Bacteroidales bacterium]|nr:fibronectin type III domain-containing protein [Bacteroidales bacterium]
MGYLIEPEGINFIINEKPLTDGEDKAISKYIKADKAKRNPHLPIVRKTIGRKWQAIILLVFSLSIVNCQLSIAQIFPVNVNTQLAPPYSVYLADYAAPGCEQLRVVLIQRDMTQASYQLFLRMSISLNGREIIRTSGNYRPSPLTVSPGVPTVISGSDLYHYLDPQNMDFTGYSRESYIRTKSLPEGQYQITFTAFDYTRPDVAVSQPGMTFCYLMKAEPPLLNMPPNQYVQPAMPVQSMLFSWLPRTVASPNSYNSTEYLLELFEIRPAGYNPNEIVNSTRPVFTTTLSSPQYMYNITDPPLAVGMQYAWRVRAIDVQGRDAIRNNGYSEVFTFTYGDADGTGTETPISAAVATDFTIEPAGARRATATWTTNPDIDGYKLMYRRLSPPSGEAEGAVWKEEQTAKNTLDINGLVPGANYEARLQSKQGTRWGGYSDLVTFTMPELQVIECGDAYAPDPERLHRRPLEELKPYAEIDAGGFPVTVLEATGSNGHFSGRGYIQVAMLGYVKLKVTFNNIFVN